MNDRIAEIEKVRELLLEGKFDEAKELNKDRKEAKMSVEDVLGVRHEDK